ncbi:MAG: hypothetical protein AAF915_23950 [Cyanobacteria bacterium P01_D01_bin.50]
MVFSTNSQPETITASRYGIINVEISAQPLVQGTTVKEHVFFAVSVKIYNCTRSVLQSLLVDLRTEILHKIDKILIPLTGTIGDEIAGNYAISTVGYGIINTSIRPTPLIQNTINPDEIVFATEIELLNCSRTKISDFLETIDTDVMQKVDDIL